MTNNCIICGATGKSGPSGVHRTCLFAAGITVFNNSNRRGGASGRTTNNTIVPYDDELSTPGGEPDDGPTELLIAPTRR